MQSIDNVIKEIILNYNNDIEQVLKKSSILIKKSFFGRRSFCRLRRIRWGNRGAFC